MAYGAPVDIITERVLHFTINSGDKNTKTSYATRIANKMSENNIDYVCYLSANSDYYNPEFYVRRSGERWNNIMRLINEIKAPVYKYDTKTFYITNVKRDGILGNLQIVVGL